MSQEQNQEEKEIRIYSKVWDHFKLVDEKAKCLYCKKEYKRSGGNTMNLHRHMASKHPDKMEKVIEGNKKNNNTIDKFIENSIPLFTPSSFRDFLTEWIVCDDQPFTVVEGVKIRRLFRLLHSNATPPSADTMRTSVMESFNKERKKIQTTLQNAPGKISFTIDAWTSPSCISFLGITAHWISKDWDLMEILVDFRKLSGSHSGENLAQVFVECCNDLNILTKILACTTDSASNNDTLMCSLENACKDQGVDFTKKDNHIRCLAHVINLAAQDALSALKVGYLENEDEVLNQSDVSGVIQKLRKLIVKIRASPQRWEKFSRQCEVANLPDNELILDVRTRWNSTYLMIERSLKLHEALDNTATGDRDLRQWVLTDSEWNLLNEIKGLLHIFSRATNHISHKKFPTIENAVPVYNWLMDEIEKFDDDANIKKEVKDAGLLAMEKLKKYYCYTDALPYTVATILDPRLKLQYYKDHGWENNFIDTARNDINILYQTKYVKTIIYSQNSDEDTGDDLLQHIYKKRHLNDNELDQYLQAPTVVNGIDLLKWWKANESQYPNLSAMARDFLAVPATSVPVERAFSAGTDLVMQKRCCLSEDTIRACMCLKSWWK